MKELEEIKHFVQTVINVPISLEETVKGYGFDIYGVDRITVNYFNLLISRVEQLQGILDRYVKDGHELVDENDKLRARVEELEKRFSELYELDKHTGNE